MSTSERQCSVAGQVTTGLASHCWPYVTESEVYHLRAQQP